MPIGGVRVEELMFNVGAKETCLLIPGNQTFSSSLSYPGVVFIVIVFMPY